MKYPKCSNGKCMHNNKYLCRAKGFDEDIVCKQSKADAIKKIRIINTKAGQIEMGQSPIVITQFSLVIFTNTVNAIISHLIT